MNNPMETENINDQAFDIITGMLKHMHRKENVEALAREIPFRFGSANAMFAADQYIWQQLGLRPNDALLMSKLSDISRYVDHSSYGRHPRLNTVQSAINYLVSNSRNLQVERFYMLCLNRCGYLKEKILLHEGTADCALLNLPKLLREVVRISPTSVILSHNHPGGTMSASADDVSSTRCVMNALSTIGIPVLDHLIVVGNRGISIRLSGYIPEADWLKQRPNLRLLAAWPEILE